MKSIAIVTDSNCGMSPAQVKDLGIYMLPMPFFIDDKEYLEDIDMNQSEFFQHLEQNPGCKVSTSQPTPESVTTLWDKLLKDYDEIVHIPMSSGLSSSMQTARMLAEDYDGRVRVETTRGSPEPYVTLPSRLSSRLKTVSLPMRLELGWKKPASTPASISL